MDDACRARTFWGGGVGSVEVRVTLEAFRIYLFQRAGLLRETILESETGWGEHLGLSSK